MGHATDAYRMLSYPMFLKDPPWLRDFGQALCKRITIAMVPVSVASMNDKI
jgi:hypothetical protein